MLNSTIIFMCLTVALKNEGLWVLRPGGAALCADDKRCICYAPGQRKCEYSERRCVENVLYHVRSFFLNLLLLLFFFVWKAKKIQWSKVKNAGSYRVPFNEAPVFFDNLRLSKTLKKFFYFFIWLLLNLKRMKEYFHQRLPPSLLRHRRHEIAVQRQQ